MAAAKETEDESDESEHEKDLKINYGQLLNAEENRNISIASGSVNVV